MDARTWPGPVKLVARVLFPPVAAFFTLLAEHYTRREEAPGTRLCVRYAGGDGEVRELFFTRCEGSIERLQGAWEQAKDA